MVSCRPMILAMAVLALFTGLASAQVLPAENLGPRNGG